jgi:glycosyltransferase involved in cell wall biosynthesis
MPMESQFREANIPIFCLGANSRTDIRVAWKLWRILARLRPDILHTYLIHANLLGRTIGRLARVPVVVSSERTIGQAGRLGVLANRVSSRLVTRVETNSEAGKQYLQGQYGIQNDKIEVVRSGVDLDTVATKSDGLKIRRELGLPAGCSLITYVGRLRHVKGVGYAIRAFAELSRAYPGARFAIAGGGDCERDLVGLTAQLGITDRVMFLGPRNDVAALLAATDIVILPSLTEGFPRIALEAMAASRPIVATAVGGTREAVIDGETGTLVPAEDAAALASAVGRLLADPALAKRMGESGRRRVEAEFSLEKYIQRLDGFYSGLWTGARRDREGATKMRSDR